MTNDTPPKYRIWAQGGTDHIGHASCLAKLLPHLQSVPDPGFSLDFQTTTPSVTSTHALTEFRFGRAAIRGAIEAKRQGYDAYLMNQFQDAGLTEPRCRRHSGPRPGRNHAVARLPAGPQDRPDRHQPGLRALA